MSKLKIKREPFEWLTEESRLFLQRGYLLEGVSAKQRIRQIAEHAEKVLIKQAKGDKKKIEKLKGFADKFYEYMGYGWFSLSSPIWANFALERGADISCVTGDTWINTINGGKQAKDIEIGDLVLTHKNRYKKVTKIIPTKQKNDIYKLKVLTRMTNLYITGNHLVLTNLGWVKIEDLNKDVHLIATNGKIDYVETNHIIDMKEYVKYDYVLEDGLIKKKAEGFDKKSLKKRKNETHMVNTAMPKEFVEIDNDLAWAFGLWFAEGNIAKNAKKEPNGLRITLDITERSLAEKWYKTMTEKFNLNGKIRENESVRNGRVNKWITVDLHGKCIGDFFATFGIGCKVKEMPEWLLNLPKEHLENLLQGLLDGDGSLRKHNANRITLANPKLILQIYNICLKLNKKTSLQMQEKAPKMSTTRYVYSLYVRDYEKSKVERNSIRKGVEFSDGLIYCPIEVLQKTEKIEDVYDFTVEDDHSFSCAGVVVHNCFGSYIHDSINGIMSTTAEVGSMSKIGGGTSGYFGSVRPRGAAIKDNGKSNGSFSFLKLFDTTINVVAQGSSRRGMFAGYTDVEHGDIEEWLDIHTEGNPIQLMHYGVCVGNHWLKEMKEGDYQKRIIWSKVLTRKRETGLPYIFFKDNANLNTVDVYKDKNKTIYASNMCVAGYTNILTKEFGHHPIQDLENKVLTVWNGEQWSENVKIVKTNTNQDLIRVVLSNGIELDVTDYHKWYVQNQDENGKKTKVEEKRTFELKVGDKLEKFELPIIDGQKQELENAYTNGIYSAEGTKTSNLNTIYLYGEKKYLSKFLTGELSSVFESQISDRLEYRFKNLREKYFVPDHTYSIKSRLEWLAGYLDGDGCIHRTGKTQQITAASTNKDFLEKIYYMLQTLGVKSKISLLRESGLQLLPKNDGSGECGYYNTKDCYRLLISAKESQKLLELGLVLNRLKISKEEVNREASRFIEIVEIKKISGKHDTYCCTEPLRNKVIFNGVMTGNCTEIMLPSSVDESFVCCLASMNLLHFEEWKNTDAPKVLTYFLDVVMSEFIRKVKNEPYMQKARKFAENHRALGVGVLGWHSYLQSNNIPFDSFEASMKNREIFKILKEKTYEASKELADLFGEPEILKGYGRRNTTLMAIAPTKSSSFILGEVSQGIEPFKSNYVIKDTAKVKKTWKNPYLIKLLQEKGMDNEEIWESIMIHDGSVQHLSFLTEHEKDVFKTFGEISQLGIIQQAAQRQKYIDQGQSLSIMIHPKTDPKDINKLYMTAAELGIKSIYYQYSINAAQAFNRSLLECSSCEA